LQSARWPAWALRRIDYFFSAPAAISSVSSRSLKTQRTQARVRELGRRLVALDATPTRQLRLAEIFLKLKMYPELEGALTTVVCASPVPPRSVDRFRAQAAASQLDWPRRDRVLAEIPRPGRRASAR